MSPDEPFTFDQQGAFAATPALMNYVREEVQRVTALRALLGNDWVIRTAEVPDAAPLQVPEGTLDEKFMYARTRQANAMQLFFAREKLKFPDPLRLATCINVQRMFECSDFLPMRNWRYYPVVDPLLDSGVPRSVTDLPMLKHIQVAVEIPTSPSDSYLYVYDGGDTLLHPLLLLHEDIEHG